MGRAPNTTKDNRRDTMNSNAKVSDIISDAPDFIESLSVGQVLEVVERIKAEGFFDSKLAIKWDSINASVEVVKSGPYLELNRGGEFNDVIQYLIHYGADVIDLVRCVTDKVSEHLSSNGDKHEEATDVESALTVLAIGLHYAEHEEEYEEAKKPEPKQVTVRVMVEVYVDGRLVEDREVVEADAEYRGPDDEDFDDALNYDLCGLDSEVADLVARALED